MTGLASRDCAVVISTCDNYSDIWEPFFALLHKFWPDLPYPVFINSETLDCYNDNVAVTTLKARENHLSWTRRLKEALERIDADYIIFMLDDFFLYDYVETDRLEQCLSYMRRDLSIGAIYFSSFGYQTEECDLPELEKCKHMARGKVNLTLALWRRDVFLYYLNYDETAWEFEANSLEHSLERNDTFYSFSISSRIIIPYDYAKYGLFAGKWFRSTIDLFSNNEIQFDFSARGFYEEYEFGTIPYVTRQIRMDSYLVPCYSLMRDNPRLDAEEVVEEGYFLQRYDVSGAQGAAIWFPSSIPGYAIEDFKCTITFKSGMMRTVGVKDVFGSFVLYRDAMFFLRWHICVYILPNIKQEMTCITIEGCMNKHWSRNDLAIAYGMDVRDAPAKFKELLDMSRIYAETLLLNGSFVSFRSNAKLCFKYNGKFDQEKAICDGRDRFPGCFVQSFKIDKTAENIVRWDIEGSFGGYAIENLKVEMIYGNATSAFLEPQHINGDGVPIDKYWVFLSANAHLMFSLPGDCPDEIRISGTVTAPMPRRVLRAVIYPDGTLDGNKASGDEPKTEYSRKMRSGLINLNQWRFIIAIAKRGIEKYGVFGVAKKAAKRLLRR